MSDGNPARARSLKLGLALALGSPVAALAVIWAVVNVALRLAPDAARTVWLASMTVWIASIFAVARGAHMILWHHRTGILAPGWAKALLSLVFTLLWLGIFVKALGLLFPASFKLPGG
jgi:hypothetical protein